MKLKLTVTKTFRVPSLAGWLCLVALSALLLIGMVRAIHPFLALNKPLDAKVMVVEGWLSDYALAEAAREFKVRHYSLVFTIGGPLEQGFYLAEYSTHARLCRATLMKLGIDSAAIIALPAPERKMDRTYAGALEIRKWMDTTGKPLERINLVSMGAHARRSLLLFQKAVGPTVRAGVICCADETYAPSDWWKSSNGFRKVTDEAIAYCYARFVFTLKNPAKP
jgi:uncharacterized SAM-binding protein YcdF (DUF218 family)